MAILDASDPREIEALKRELETRKELVESIAKGLGDMLKRVKQRLDELDDLPPTTPNFKPKA